MRSLVLFVVHRFAPILPKGMYLWMYDVSEYIPSLECYSFSFWLDINIERAVEYQ